MSTIDIHLPDALKAYLDEQISSHGYKDASEYFQELLEAEKFRDLREELEQSLVDAMNEPSTPLADKDFDDVIREGMEIIKQRRQQ